MTDDNKIIDAIETGEIWLEPVKWSKRKTKKLLAQGHDIAEIQTKRTYSLIEHDDTGWVQDVGDITIYDDKPYITGSYAGYGFEEYYDDNYTRDRVLTAITENVANATYQQNN